MLFLKKTFKDYFNWLHANFICAIDEGNQHISQNDFYGMVKHCLDHEPQILDILSSSAFSLGQNTKITLKSENESIIIDKLLLKRVFHKENGICFTLDPNHWRWYEQFTNFCLIINSDFQLA